MHFAAALDSGLAIHIGDGATNGDGNASMTQRGGIGARLMRGDRAVAHEATFELWQEKHGKEYCRSTARAKLTCNGGSCPHLDQPMPSP